MRELPKLLYGCNSCKKLVHPVKHFISEDGVILCYKCRIKMKAKPYFKSPIGIRKEGEKG